MVQFLYLFRTPSAAGDSLPCFLLLFLAGVLVNDIRPTWEYLRRLHDRETDAIYHNGGQRCLFGKTGVYTPDRPVLPGIKLLKVGVSMNEQS